MSYLDLAGFKARTIMPSADVDLLDAVEPQWLETKIADVSDEIDAQLAKRYVVPFGDASLNTVRANVPRIVLGWVAAIVTADAYAKRGVNPSSPYDQATIIDPALRARAEIKAAADATGGLYELPLRDGGTEGVTRGSPLAYSEQSPYTWATRQREDADGES